MESQNRVAFTHHTNLEVNITTAKQKFVFGENDTLRDKKVKAIDVFKVADVSVSPLGNALINATVFNKSYLVLVIDGKENVNRIPLAALAPTVNNGKRFNFPGKGVVIDWAKSYIELPNTTSQVVGESFLFNVYYDDTKTC